ncbi:MAG: hypothetical protein HPY69_03020 [Armatimonadetes bacterium]|nr:hypothetical protein [Armatimonadota bacterium]
MRHRLPVPRAVSVMVLLCCLMVVSPLLAQIQRNPNPRLTVARPLDLAAIQSSQALRLNEFRQVMDRAKVPENVRRTYESSFQQLPPDLQLDLLSHTSVSVAQALDRRVISESIVSARVRPDLVLRFAISSIWPDQGPAGGWAYIFGVGFGADCKALLDGSMTESYYVEYSEFFPRSVAFRIPSGTSRGVDHQVVVRNTATNKSTSAYTYRVVAPRGYRGYWGWQFANFSWTSIPWELYRDYFGQGTVEYADGTHRPAAQSWFDSAYTKAGQGGNCYGMSVSSLRLRNAELHTYWHGWFDNPANHQAYTWFYPWRVETRQTVQEDQGAWYTQEVLDVHTSLYNAQTHRQVFDRAASLVNQLTNRPVLVIWAPTWGHAMVPYKTEVAGDDRRIFVWDNNNPYREDETGSTDPNVAHVAWGSNTFSYGGANKAVCMSYEECTPANPHLPGSEYGGPGAETVVAVLSPGTRATQITDEKGRRFFNPDGSVNNDPNTRITNSMRVLPLVLPPYSGNPPSGAEAPRLPANYPDIYVFRQAAGKSLTFSLAGQQAKQLNLYSHGMVFELQAAGAGEVRLLDLLRPSYRAELPTPGTLQVSEVGFIRSRGVGDRVLRALNFRNLGAQSLVVGTTPDGGQLEVRGAAGLQFDLRLIGPAGRGQQGGLFRDLQLQQGTRAVIIPTNWASPAQSALNLQLRNLQSNQLERQIQVPRGQ